MKLKRFVAIVISLAMVLSIVPAFSLTASAADYTSDELISMATYTFDGSGSNGLVNGGGSDINISNITSPDHWTGWSSSWGGSNITDGSGTNVNIIASGSNNYVQTYGAVVSDVSKGATVTTSSAVQTGTAGKDYWILEFSVAGSSGNEHDYGIYDVDGTLIDSFRHLSNRVGYYYADNAGGAKTDYNSGQMFTSLSYSRSNTSNWLESGSSNPYLRFVYANDEDGDGYTVSCYYSSDASTYTLSTIKTFATGTVNGFGKVVSAPCNGSSGWWTNTQIHNPKVYAGNYPAASKTIVATYTVGGTTVNEVSKTIDTSTTSSASFDEYYYSVNGTNTLYYAAAQTLTDSATIEMTALENWSVYDVDDSVTVDSTPYAVKSTNLIPNGNFSYGKNGWYTGISTAMADGFSLNGDGTAKGINNNGTAGASSVWRAWATEAGKTYLLTFDSTVTSGYYVVSEKADLTATSDGTVVTTAVAGTNTKIYTATQPYLLASFRWMNGASVGNFGLYEVEVDSSKIANTTIKFVDSSDGTTEIADAVTITGVVGDTIDLNDTSIVPETITYNSNLYSKDSTNATSYTVADNTVTVTITYTTDAVTSFAAVTATVIEGNDPILPTTITGYTGSGASTDVTVTWTDYTGLAAGTHTITGTADGINATPTATVTVLSETFSLADTDVPASSDTTLTFPESISGEFVMEFDYTPSNVQNNWIYISADGALWGSGQIGIGTNNDQTGTLKAQPSTELGVVESGKTYRMLVTGDASTDTYTLVVTHEDGTTWTADSTFRAASDYINSIRMLPNGNTGSFAVKNIKVHNANSSLQTITINATGSVSETTTVKATSAEVAPIPHYDGHIMKTRTISGNTVTATYEATTTSTGSWYMRNNFTDDNWITQSKYIGSHNAFADTDEVFDNEGGALYGDSATDGSSTYVSKSRAQSVGALDQLNAGVRYFDIRLSRQEDGTFAVTHGPAFENFRDVAITMAQWAKENPGEVIILDFQTVRDALYGGSATGHYEVITDNDSYYGPDAGDDNQYIYDALVQLFEETGLADYMTTNWDRKYGPITNYGTQTAILPFGKGRAVNCQGSYFVNRSALNNDVTYTEASSYSDIVSNLDSTYSSLTDGATISTIHAYTTPGILSTASLLSSAASNNPNWINETNFEAWMGYGKGDVFMMNDSVSNIDLYYNKLNSFNRTGSTYSYSADFTRTDDGVTITGAQANVPYSTKFTVDVTNNEVTTVDGVEYTTKAAYEIALMQFNRDSVQPKGEVTLTFPKASADDTTVDVLFFNDEVVYTAGVGEAISYTTSELGTYVVATMAAPSVEYTVTYVTTDGETLYTDGPRQFLIGQDAYNFAASERAYVKLGDNAYIVSNEAQSKTIAASDANGSSTVTFTLIERYAVLEDMLVDSDNHVWGINAANENSIFVAAAATDRRGPLADADGTAVRGSADPSTLGASRTGFVQFPVVSLADGEAAIANFYVRTWHGNTFSNGNDTIRISATAINDDSWTTLTDGSTYTDLSAPQFTGYTKAMFSNAATNNVGYIQIDVTDMMKAAEEAGLSTITLRLATGWGAAYIAEREACVAGGTYEGNAAFIDVVEGYTISVSGTATQVTKMGTVVDDMTSIVVPASETIKIYDETEGVVAYTDGTQVYVVNTIVAPEASGTLAPATLGVAPVDGAQVRIGDGVDGDGKVEGTNSGLRFITEVDYTDSLAAVEGATFGVRITAEGSDSYIDITTADDKWQNDTKTIYTSALTNLAVSNYNRKFTAKPYVIADGQTFYGSEVTRSIYQVAAGLLANDTDGTTYDDAALSAKSMINVLNAYVNQTGIRLAIVDGDLAIHDQNSTSTKGGKYSSDAFFTLVSATNANNVYSITIQLTGANTEVKGYWQEYIRINNNNSTVAEFTELTNNDDGTITITFDYASYLVKYPTTE